MSSQAWADYEVPGAPYFVLVDGAMRGEGVATTWHALASLVGDAIEDQREAAGRRRRRSSGTARIDDDARRRRDRPRVTRACTRTGAAARDRSARLGCAAAIVARVRAAWSP